jgi:hypothetical protein
MLKKVYISENYRHKLIFFSSNRLSIENQSNYLSKLYSLHENLNQNSRKYLNENPVTRKASLQYNFKNENKQIDQQFISTSTFSFFRGPNLNPIVKSIVNSTPQQMHNKNDHIDSFRNKADSSSFSSSSTMSFNTTTTTSTSNTRVSKNDTEPFKKTFDEISIGGKQILDHQTLQIPVIANAKLEFPQKIKPVSIESINRIRKVLNLDEINTNGIHQHTQNKNGNYNFANLKLRLKESRIRNDNIHRVPSIDAQAGLFIQTSRSIKESNEKLKTNVKPKLPNINSIKKTDNFGSNNTPRKHSKLNDSYPFQAPPTTPNAITTTNEENEKNHNDGCFLCELTVTKPARKEYQPLITILTATKPITQVNAQNPFYLPIRTQMSNHGLIYQQNSYKNYRSPAPSPEILI